MLTVTSKGAVLTPRATIEIGCKYNTEPAKHRVDGVYWERNPHIDLRLQSALLSKGKPKKYKDMTIGYTLKVPK